MSLKIRLLAILLTAMVAAPARADQVRFTGTTSVDAVVIRDTLQNILRVAAARGCNQLSAVEARMLPAAYRPPGANEQGPRPGLRYERWTATLCGAPMPFLVGFWPASDGGTMFQIVLPYPVGAPPPLPETPTA
jgi:hypothetical protein